MGFFDKLKEQASGLGAQLDDALKGTKTSSTLNALNKQRNEKVMELGEAALDQIRSGALNQEALNAYAQQIFNLEQQIIQVRQEADAAKQAAAAAKMTPPPPPGGAAAPPPPPQAATQPPPPPPAAAAVSNCASCGASIPEGAAFCPNCGAKSS